MNSFVIAFVAAVAVLSQASANCIPACGNIVASPLLLPSPVLSPIVSAPIVPTTTIVQTRNPVTDSLVDTLQMLVVANTLADQLPFGPNVYLPVASPVLSAPIVSSCGCGLVTSPIVSSCGCGPIINPCGCGSIIF